MWFRAGRDREILDIAIHYAGDVIAMSSVINLFPSCLKPCVPRPRSSASMVPFS